MRLVQSVENVLRQTLCFAVLCSFAAGCQSESDGYQIEGRSLRVAVLPDASPERLKLQYAPLINYLSDSTGFEIRLDVPEDYDELLAQFEEGEVDLAWFGGLTFAQAQARFGAMPLVTRDVDVSFTSSFVARKREGDEAIARRALTNFQGLEFSFGPRLSTSGHLMPRSFLEEAGIAAERFFDGVRYSSGHDETLQWIRDGVVEIGAVNSATLTALSMEDPRIQQEVEVVMLTTPYQNYCWATPAGLSPTTRFALREAFLELDPNDPAHRSILRKLEAGGFLPIDVSDYEQLTTLASAVGLLEARP